MIFEFNEEDLRSNRRGLISPRQKEWLDGIARGIRHSQRGGFPIVIFFMLLGFGAFFGMTLANESARKAFLSDPMNLVFICGSVPVILGIVLLGKILGNRRAARLEDPELKTTEGLIQWDEETSRVGTTYYVIIGEIEFASGLEDVRATFPEDRRCRAYYCETSMLKLILSYELLN